MEMIVIRQWRDEIVNIATRLHEEVRKSGSGNVQVLIEFRVAYVQSDEQYFSARKRHGSGHINRDECFSFFGYRRGNSDGFCPFFGNAGQHEFQVGAHNADAFGR